MFGRCDENRFPKFAHPGATAACVVLSLTFAQTVTAQQLPPPSTTPPAAGIVSSPAPIVPTAPAQADPAPSTPSGPNGGLGAVQKFFEDGAANFRTHLQGAKSKWDELSTDAAANRKNFDDGAEAARKNAVEATRSAVESVSKLPTSRVVQGKERCEAAANGAPDCQTAAENLCKRQGFAGGKSLDFTSAEECPARVYLSGRQTSAECKTVTFISRAMCQ